LLSACPTLNAYPPTIRKLAVELSLMLGIDNKLGVLS
jgi:hypothetical protein